VLELPLLGAGLELSVYRTLGTMYVSNPSGWSGSWSIAPSRSFVLSGCQCPARTGRQDQSSGGCAAVLCGKACLSGSRQKCFVI